MDSDERYNAEEHHWGGTVKIYKNGYRAVNIGKRTVYEHKLIMEWYLGRPMEKGELVHHMNEIRHDNRLSNLELMLTTGHVKIHNSKKIKRDGYLYLYEYIRGKMKITEVRETPKTYVAKRSSMGSHRIFLKKNNPAKSEEEAIQNAKNSIKGVA